MNPQLRLLVLRSADIETARSFYEHLGFTFKQEKHGTGPTHYAAESGDLIVELYPATPQYSGDSSTRLGFNMENLSDAIENLPANAEVITEPKHTEWGYRAVVKDPDGRRIELYES